MKLKRYILVVLSLVLSLVLISCARNENEKEKEESSGKLLVAVSIMPEKAFVDAVAGDLVEVVCLIPPGSSPESYELSPLERAKFETSDVYFSIGVQAEEACINKSISSKTEVVDLAEVSRTVADDLLLGSQRDPHIWLSPKRAMAMVACIAEKLSVIDPSNAKVYSDNAKEYIQEIKDAASDISDVLSGLKNRSFIVFHPAFGYFAEEFSLTMLALEDEGKEATASHLAEMIDYAKASGIKVIFYQAEIDSRQSRSFAEEIGGRTIELEPLAYDYIGNMRKIAEIFREVL